MVSLFLTGIICYPSEWLSWGQGGQGAPQQQPQPSPTGWGIWGGGEAKQKPGCLAASGTICSTMAQTQNSQPGVSLARGNRRQTLRGYRGEIEENAKHPRWRFYSSFSAALSVPACSRHSLSLGWAPTRPCCALGWPWGLPGRLSHDPSNPPTSQIGPWLKICNPELISLLPPGPPTLPAWGQPSAKPEEKEESLLQPQVGQGPA